MSLGGLLVAVVALVPTGGDKPTAREQAIWSHAQSRLEQQIDIWFEDGEFPKAIHALRFENNLFPSNYEVATNLGWMQENVEDYPSATATYERYLKLNPQDPDAALPLATMLLNRKQYDRIPSLLEPAIKRSKPSPHPNTFRVLAHAHERLGHLQDSKRVWETYLRLNPKDETAKANLRRVEGKIKAAG